MDGLAESSVRRVRVRASRAAGANVESCLGRLLRRVDIQPSGFATSSILCIHRFGDPLPRRLSLKAVDVRAPEDWIAAARSTVGRVAARAVRPARESVPANAEAVLFLDRAELLACLARDWTSGVFSQRWWWRALFRAGDDAAAIATREWRRVPQYVPAACHLLATWGGLTSFVRRLNGAHAMSLTRDVARAFAVEAVERAIAARERPAEPVSATEASTANSIDVPLAGWTRLVPELEGTTLSPEQRLLVVVTLIVYRAPAVARCILSDDLVRTILDPHATPAAPRVRASVPPDTTGTGASGSSRDWRPPHNGDIRHAASAQPQSENDASNAPHNGDSNRAAEALSQCEPARASITEPEQTPPQWTGTIFRPIEAVIDTAFGGAFYLINVGIGLGLYGDFTAPRSPGIELPIWDFIALVAERLTDPEQFGADPIASFLAQLAGRDPADAPGSAFVPDTGESLEVWLDALVDRILARLAEALAVERQSVADLVFRRAARVSLSPAHLDVAFALDDLPIEVRLAGLDRNPGFVPAAGLTVTFSYD